MTETFPINMNAYKTSLQLKQFWVYNIRPKNICLLYANLQSGHFYVVSEVYNIS